MVLLDGLSLLYDNYGMQYEIETANVFDKWLCGLKDKAAANRIMSRSYRIERGNFGDYKDLGFDLFELRLFFGPGYRIYYTIKEGYFISKHEKLPKPVRGLDGIFSLKRLSEKIA